MHRSSRPATGQDGLARQLGKPRKNDAEGLSFGVSVDG